MDTAETVRLRNEHMDSEPPGLFAEGEGVLLDSKVAAMQG